MKITVAPCIQYNLSQFFETMSRRRRRSRRKRRKKIWSSTFSAEAAKRRWELHQQKERIAG